MNFEDYEIREGFDQADFAKVHAMLRESYWAEGVSRANVEKAARHSTLVVTAWYEGTLVAYLRVISDLTTFGWISDVIVEEGHQRKGIARAMVNYALRHPKHQGFRRWVLKTRDAQGVYVGCGFLPITTPEQWMDYRPPDAPLTHEYEPAANPTPES